MSPSGALLDIARAGDEGAYEHPDGLPLAVQLIGRPAQEGALLALAAQIEAALPWAGRRAPVAHATTPPARPPSPAA